MGEMREADQGTHTHTQARAHTQQLHLKTLSAPILKDENPSRGRQSFSGVCGAPFAKSIGCCFYNTSLRIYPSSSLPNPPTPIYTSEPSIQLPPPTFFTETTRPEYLSGVWGGVRV